MAHQCQIVGGGKTAGAAADNGDGLPCFGGFFSVGRTCGVKMCIRDRTFTLAELGYFDAILMDIRMPVMDGLTATRSIRQLKKKTAKTIPIIAMSANAFDEDVEKSKMAGMNAHLAKPIEPELLYATLDDFFHAGQTPLPE